MLPPLLSTSCPTEPLEQYKSTLVSSFLSINQLNKCHFSLPTYFVLHIVHHVSNVPHIISTFSSSSSMHNVDRLAFF